jgi:hypothetical protein
MTTKQRFRQGRYRLELRERDHGPAHLHLVGGGFDVISELGTLESSGRWPSGLRVEVIAWIEAHREQLLEDWNRWHP